MSQTYQVENFSYNGFFVDTKPGMAPYTAKFKEWTSDPGIAIFECSDGRDRQIPTCQLVGGDIDMDLPPQEYRDCKVLFSKSFES